VEGARGGGAGGSIRGDGLATRLPFDFVWEFDDIGVRAVGASWAAEPERAGGGIEVLGNERAGSATISGRLASITAGEGGP
jgi:hypothetical protein